MQLKLHNATKYHHQPLMVMTVGNVIIITSSTVITINSRHQH